MQRSATGKIGIPDVIHHAVKNQRAIIVMELLGASLYDLLIDCGGKFTIQTTCLIAIQIISRMEWLHHCNVIHGDIKPENIVVGIGNQANTLYVIDYGLANRYRNRVTGEILPLEEVPFYGTHAFASLNAHAHCRQSPRDDLESLGYVLISFVTVEPLPWESTAGHDLSFSQLNATIAAMKKNFVCKNEIPKQFVEYMRITRGLEYDQIPDYERLRELFKQLIEENGHSVDNQFDWNS